MEMFSEKTNPQNTLKEFIAILFKHRKKMVAFFLIVVAVVSIGTFLAARIYESEAKLYVRLGRETVSQNSATTGQTIMISQTLENQINSEIEVLKSRELAERVIKAMGADKFKHGATHKPESDSIIETLRRHIKAMLSFPKKAAAKFLMPPEADDDDANGQKQISNNVKALLNSLHAEVVPESNIINLKFESQNPMFAQEVLDTLISIYREKHLELHVSPGSYEFFKKESNRLQKQLQKAETELEVLKNEIGVGSLEEHRSILSEQIGTLQQRREEIESNIAASKARVNALENRLADLPENVVLSEMSGSTTSAVEELHVRINDLKLEKQDLLSTFTPNSIPVKDLQRQIDEAEALLQNARETRQITKGVNPIHQELKTSLMVEKGSLDALQAEKEAIKHQIKAAREDLKKLNSAEVHLVKLQRKRNLLEENYRRYANNLEQLRIDKALETEKISNISVAQAPMVPLEPISPRTGLNLALGLFLAFFGALGLPFFIEFFNTEVETPEQVEKILELPLLGSINKMDE